MPPYDYPFDWLMLSGIDVSSVTLSLAPNDDTPGEFAQRTACAINGRRETAVMPVVLALDRLQDHDYWIQCQQAVQILKDTATSVSDVTR
jgi:hypothetical protein